MMLLLQEPAAAQKITPAARAALEKLADVATPPPVSWMPHTWGWVALAAALLALVAWLVVRAIRRRIANRYRVEALGALAALDAALGNGQERGAALAAMPPLVKRVALGAWPREDVAALSGDAWVGFLRAHAGRHGLPDAAATLLADGEYRPAALAATSAEDARTVAADIRRWIEEHRVHP